MLLCMFWLCLLGDIDFCVIELSGIIQQMLICLKILKLESRSGVMMLIKLQRRKPEFMMISKIFFFNNLFLHNSST